MNVDPNAKVEEPNPQIKALEKELAILKKKFERCNRERGELESLLDQTRRLLDTVGKEKLTEEEQKQLSIFRKFVPQEFLQSLNKEGWLNIKLGDHVEHEMTVLFNDIRSFTILSEKMSTEDNFAFINDYLKYMYPPVQSNGGFVDRYIGDSVMALFYRSRDAIEAGIGMHKALIEYNKQRAKLSNPPIEIGIGLHCGKLMLGVIGVEYRLQGTVISSTVNLASHLEAMTKIYGSAMLVSQYVIQDDKDAYPTRYVGKVKLAGAVRASYMDIFEILSAEREDILPKKIESKPFCEEGIKMYYDKRFAEASVKFTQSLKVCPNDKAVQYFLKQSAQFMVSGVPEDWDGAQIL